jgi:hypothetical protein
MASLYQSPVNNRSRKVEEKFMHKLGYHYFFHFPGLEFIHTPSRVRWLAFSKLRSCLHSQKSTSWKIILEPMAGNVVISEVDALMYVALSEAEKTRALWGIGWYHRMCAILAEV